MTAQEIYATQTEFTIQRHTLERAVRGLSYLEGIALIRAGPHFNNFQCANCKRIVHLHGIKAEKGEE